MAISDQRKAGILQMEFGSFISQMGAVKRFSSEIYTYKGQSCLIYKDSEDAEAKEKAKAAKLAVRTIIDKKFNLPTDLRFYCTQHYQVQNRVFNRDGNWNNVSWITLGTTALKNGRADAISAMINPGFTKGAVTCIHEMGHALHAHARGDDFFDAGSNLSGGAAATAGQVSGYAAMNKKEFVAEVFAGLMIGRLYSNAVMTEYLSYGGPH